MLRCNNKETQSQWLNVTKVDFYHAESDVFQASLLHRVASPFRICGLQNSCDRGRVGEGTQILLRQTGNDICHSHSETIGQR